MSLFQWVLWRFYQKSYPYAGKTHDFGQERHEQKSEKKRFAATNVRIPYAKRIVFKKRAQKTTQGKMTLTMQVLHGCTFFPCQTHIRARDTKIRKKWKSMQKVKKIIKIGHRPVWSPKWYKTKHLARVQNGPLRGDVSLESKIDPNWRFRSSKNDEKTCRVLRVLPFSHNGFSDRLWQNNIFRYIICKSFWKKSFKRGFRRAAAVQNV